MLEEINNDIENNLIPENRIKYSYKTKILASLFFALSILGGLLYYCGYIYSKKRVAYYGMLLLYIDVVISCIFGCYMRYKATR